MIQVIRTVDIGDWENPHPWKAIMFECDTNEEAIEWINKQSTWLQRELSLEDEENCK